MYVSVCINAKTDTDVMSAYASSESVTYRQTCPRPDSVSYTHLDVYKRQAIHVWMYVELNKKIKNAKAIRVFQHLRISFQIANPIKILHIHSVCVCIVVVVVVLVTPL